MKAAPLRRYALFFAIAGGGLALDLASKQYMFDWLGMPDMPGDHLHWLKPGLIAFQTALNEGALFGIGQGMAAVFSLLSIAAAIGVLMWLFLGDAAQDLLLTLALGAVTAGILGNLYDRLGLPGLHWSGNGALHNVGAPVHAVRDWILVMIGTYHWPNFNVADSLLVTGAMVLVLQTFRKGKSC
jgi:signal peptidase II